MRFSFAAILSAFAFFAATVNAQGININYPANGTTLRQGQSVTVQVVRPDNIEAAVEVGVAIGLVNCGNSPCPDPEDELGDVLLVAPFNPQFHTGPVHQQYENFTIKVPKTFTLGHAQLAVDRFFLIGAGPAATTGYASILVTIAA